MSFAREVWLERSGFWRHLVVAALLLAIPVWGPGWLPGEIGGAGVVIGFVAGFEVCAAIYYPLCQWSRETMESLVERNG